MKLFQMDVKNAFLNEILCEKMYVELPKGFGNPKLPNHVYRLKKTLYGLKKKLLELGMYLLEKGFEREEVDRT